MSIDMHSEFVALEANLRRYLPEQLVSLLLGQPSIATARPCDEHLDALLHAVSTYLPRYLVNEHLLDPRPGHVSGRFQQATVMFADISGFTAMSERLSRRGEEGAEEITRIVGDNFAAMLDITTRQGGDLLKFGGDALLVAFFGQDHAVRACRAAAQMQQAIARFSQVEAFGETFSLKMTTGLGSGSLLMASLGTPEKMEYTLMGEALTNMAHAEDQAEGGEILLDQATYQAVQSEVQTGEIRKGCYQVTHVSPAWCDCPLVLEAMPALRGDDMPAMQAHIQETIACLDALTPFLPPGLLEQLRFDPARMASRERGEFRPVTVMFANFYGTEEIIRQLGPDKTAEITAILNAHYTRMQDIIRRYEGVIDKVISYVVGHQIMALFGAPHAHVDDPERAVRAACDMQAAMSTFGQLATSAGVFALKQRIGINTGRVFAGNVGSEARHEYTVMGDEVNLTSRLMSAAHEGQVLISQSTAAQIGQRFLLDEQSPVRVKGKGKPVPNYEVRGVVERHEAEKPVRRAPLVGRDSEWQAIWQVAQQAMGGECRVLDIHGEMGMGKSRVLQELVDRWTGQGGIAFLAVCLSYGQHTPYAPWVSILRQVFGLRDDDSDLERGEKIVSRLMAANPAWGDWAALVANLLGVPMPESDLLKTLDPKLRQQNLQRMVNGLIVSASAHRPTLVALDDVQWIDEASLAMLNHLTTPKPYPLLICIAYRPEESQKLAQSGYTRVSLQALSEAGGLALLDSQLPTAPEMPQRLRELILKNAQGNPLFIVEMTRALIENYLTYDAASGVYRARADLDRVQVPDTVSRVILSRLDRLDEQSRNLLKVASVIGREFQKWLLQSIYPYRADETEMEASLLNLSRKEILEHIQVAYLFRHVVMREVAYESLLYAERRDLHGRIARSIEQQQGAHMDEYVEVLAEHCTLAEDWPSALQYHLKAGRRAQAVFANQDAIHRFQKALQAAGHIPDSRGEQLVAHEGLGDTYQLVGRYDESLGSYAQARAVSDQMPVSPEVERRQADLCRKTGHIHEYRGEYDQALMWIERGLRLLQAKEFIETARLYLAGAAVFQREGQWQDVILWCRLSLDIAEKLTTREAQQVAGHAYYLLGNGYRRLGETEKAGLHYRRSLDTYQALEDSPGIARAYNNLATFYRYQDDWVRATDHYQQALSILERIGDLHGQAVIANNLAEVLLNRGQLDDARAWYQRSLDISKELGLNFGVALVYNNLGFTFIRAQAWDQALGYLQQSLEMFQRIGAEEFLPELYRHLAEAHLGRGNLDEALSWAEGSLERALAAETKLEEGCTRRVLGSVCHARGQIQEAETQLQHSIRILEGLASSYEVARTAIQLAAVYSDQGDKAQADRLRQQAVATFERLGAELDLTQAVPVRRT